MCNAMPGAMQSAIQHLAEFATSNRDILHTEQPRTSCHSISDSRAVKRQNGS